MGEAEAVMRFGSVCSGIEAASAAWHPLGWEAAWFSEIEPFPCAVLAHHYPEVPNHGDMTKLPQLIRSGEVEAPDLFCGGTPCQAFSVAGLRRSLDDARGNLSLTFCEIADAIDAVRRAGGKPASIVFWENVPGVLSTSDNAFGCFLGALAGCDTAIEPLAATGWTDAGVVAGPVRSIAWRVLDAQYFGLAQRRRRVFVVASAREDFDPATVLLEFEGVRRDSAPCREARKVAPTIPARSLGGGGLGTDFDCDGGIVQVCTTLRAGGNSTGGDRPPGTDVDTVESLQVVGIPDPAYAITGGPDGRQFGTGRDSQDTFITHSLRGEGFDASEDGTGPGTPLVPVAFAETAPTLSCGAHGAAGHPHRQHGNETAIVGMAHAFDARQSDVIQYGDKTGPLDTDGHSVAVAFSIMPMNSGRDFKGRETDVAQPLMAGGPVGGNQGGDFIVQPTVAIRTANTSSNGHGISAELAHTLDQAQGQAVVQATSVGVDTYNGTITGELAATISARNGIPDATGPRVMTAMQVRRLTPVECERLQGFPDHYTAIPWRGKPAAECPDGPRYKALGNSWAVPVVRWIGERINAVTAAQKSAPQTRDSNGSSGS